jgi:hypothetical protein
MAEARRARGLNYSRLVNGLPGPLGDVDEYYGVEVPRASSCESPYVMAEPLLMGCVLLGPLQEGGLAPTFGTALPRFSLGLARNRSRIWRTTSRDGHW